MLLPLVVSRRMWDERRWDAAALGGALAAAPPPRRRRGPATTPAASGSTSAWCAAPNALRGGRWEWTPEEVTALASTELGRDVALVAVGATLKKLVNAEGLLLQRQYLIRLGVGFAHPWLVARLAAVLPALRSLQSIYFMDGLPAAAAAALGAVPALARLHADVERFEDGSLAALARALAAPGSAVRNLVLVPCRRNMPPPYNPPPDADVARLAAAVMDPCVPTATTAAFHSSPCTSRRIGTTAQACACRCSPAASPP
jgi:hypothetical protein